MHRAGEADLFVFPPMTPIFVPKPLANFMQAGSQPILLPWRSGFHAVAAFTQALAHAPAMLTAAFPFLAIARYVTIIGAAVPPHGRSYR
jgi:hypothetical protein